MNHNGYSTTSRSELSEYQKKIESIDNVILCVAEAERMLNEVGRSLLTEPVEELSEKRRNHFDPEN